MRQRCLCLLVELCCSITIVFYSSICASPTVLSSVLPSVCVYLRQMATVIVYCPETLFTNLHVSFRLQPAALFQRLSILQISDNSTCCSMLLLILHDTDLGLLSR